MPPAVALAGAGLAGAGASAGNGKKASNAAKQQLQVQQQQLQLEQGLISQAKTAWQPAADYWNSLLSGNQTLASQAVSPYANIIKQQAQATQRNLLSSQPSGGEANLARATAAQGTNAQLAQLYAGVQPTAANSLGSLAGTAFGAGSSAGGTVNPNIGAAAGILNNQSNQVQQGITGLGPLLYQAIHKPQQSGNSVNPTFAQLGGTAGLPNIGTLYPGLGGGTFGG